MKKHVKLFSNETGDQKSHKNKSSKKLKLSYEESMKLYEAMIYKVFEPGEKICEYGAVGDRFYIILQGFVSVRQPKDVNLSFNTAWDVYNHLIDKYEHINSYRDEHSKEISSVITLVGAPLLKELAFKQVRKLIDFLRKLEL